METNPNHKALRVVTFSEQKLELMGHYHHKLNHLHGGKVFLPPDESTVFRPQCCYHVVEVHHNVHKGVEKSKEGTMATWGKLEAHPN